MPHSRRVMNLLLPSEKEGLRACRLIHIQRFAIRIVRTRRDVMQFEIRECSNPYDIAGRLEARSRELIARQINRDRWGIAGLQIARRVIANWVRYRSSPFFAKEVGVRGSGHSRCREKLRVRC